MIAEDEGVRKADFDPDRYSEHQRREKDIILTRFFNILFPAVLLFGAIAVILSLFRSFRYGWHVTSTLLTAMYVFSILVLAFRRRLPNRVVLGLFLGLMAVAAVHSLYTFGLAGGGMMILALLCVFAGVFLGVKGGLISVGASVLVVSITGFGICTGSMAMHPDILNILHSPTTWSANVVLFLLFTLPLAFIINYMHKRIVDGLHSVVKTNKQLQQEIATKAAMENELRESESRYRSIVENSLVAFTIVQDGRFRFVNSRYCDMTGYTYDELVDKMGPLDVTRPDQREKLAEDYRRLLTGELVTPANERIVLKKDGTPITVKALGNRLTYLGQPAVFGSLIDITNEKLLESKLIQSQKMEAIGTLAGGIAHDFNNILSALMGFGTMLHMALEDRNPLKRYASNILSASEKAAGLTQSLLTFSREETAELKPVKINTVIKESEDLLRRVITEDIDVNIDLSPMGAFILADAIQINQILFNLVANARDAMPRGGRLEISTAIEEIDEHFILHNGFGKKGWYCRLSVSDNGIGMEKATIDKIFDPFFTTKETGKGTGLGLSTVYGIVKQHHGYIRVSSRVDNGTSFNVYFPAIDEDAVIEHNPKKNYRKGYETILVAEDDSITRDYIRDLLTHYGYRVIEAEDGEDALDKLQSNEEIPLCILDSIMPGKNGKEVYDAVKEQRPDIRVLFISGYPRDIILSKGLLDPGMEFMSKPLYPEKFMGKVEEILDRGKTESA